MPAKKDSKKNTERDLKEEIEKSAKLFDVAKPPGKTRASASSRPLIVGHTPMIKNDPMVREEKEAPPDTEDKIIPVKPHKTPVIKPLSEQEQENEKEATDKQSDDNQLPSAEVKSSDTENEAEASIDEAGEAANKPKADNEASDQADTEEKTPEATKDEEATKQEDKEAADSNVKTSESEEEDSSSSDENSESTENKGVVDALTKEVGAKHKDQKEAEEQAALEAEAEKLIQSKQYFVPIGQVSRKRTNNLVAIFMLLLVILCVAGLNFAVDAEMVDIGVEPFTNIL